jgi:hypothetical protein
MFVIKQVETTITRFHLEPLNGYTPDEITTLFENSACWWSPNCGRLKPEGESYPIESGVVYTAVSEKESIPVAKYVINTFTDECFHKTEYTRELQKLT